MLKSTIYMLLAVLVLVVGVLYEQNKIHGDFAEFNAALVVLYDKTEREIAVKDDALAVQKVWLSHKSSLHIYIPHNDIREFDMWMSETVNYIEEKNYKEALPKLEVLIELTEQIPNFYKLKWENVF